MSIISLRGEAELGAPFPKVCMNLDVVGEDIAGEDEELGAPFPKVCKNLDVVGEDNEMGLRISLDAETPVCKLPFSMFTRDLFFPRVPVIGEG